MDTDSASNARQLYPVPRTGQLIRLGRRILQAIRDLSPLKKGRSLVDDDLEPERVALVAARLLMLGEPVLSKGDTEKGASPGLIAADRFNWDRCYSLAKAVCGWSNSRGILLKPSGAARVVAILYRRDPGGSPGPGCGIPSDDEISAAA